MSNQDDEGFDIYRGCLKLPPKATIEDHRKAKESFLLSVRRWASRHGLRFELHGVIHVTATDEAHWEVVAWTDAPKTKLADYFGKAWKRHGGFHQSIVPVAAEDLEAACEYHGKPVVRSLDGGDKAYIPAANGLEASWHTSGFWGDTTMEAVWDELREEWFPPNGSPMKEIQLTDTPGENPDIDRVLFPRKLPKKAERSVGLATFAARWGVTPDYMMNILSSVPNVRRTNGELIAGNHHFNGYWLDVKGASGVPLTGG